MINIYIITNKINSKVYVGQTHNTLKARWADHKKPSSTQCIKLHRAINKYGAENFIIEVIIQVETQAEADQQEINFIEQYQSIKYGYNIRSGGSRGKMSEEQKKAVGDFHRGKIVSEDTKTKMAKSLRKLTDEQIFNIQNDDRFSKIIAKEYGVSRETILRIKKKSLRCYQ